MAEQAKQGDNVSVHYTGSLQDGEVFDSSRGKEPLDFKIGEKKVIPGFEKAVVGMNVGESKRVVIPADEAYGPHLDKMVVVIERQRLPEGMDPKIGQRLQLGTPDGDTFIVVVKEVSEASVTLDGNHPLAGKDLTFEIELVAIV